MQQVPMPEPGAQDPACLPSSGGPSDPMALMRAGFASEGAEAREPGDDAVLDAEHIQAAWEKERKGRVMWESNHYFEHSKGDLLKNMSVSCWCPVASVCVLLLQS